MTKTMLIDATHSEETRVAIVDGNRLVEYDYESKVRKQLKGSIFLAKVTRVEPSLQAAFVNFGGNRHGFLPFSEIHPDYFRIPVADREALIAAQRAELEEHDEEMQQEESEIEEAGSSLEPAAEAEDEEELEPVVEVGGEDQPLDDEEEEETKEAVSAVSDAEDPENTYRPPMAMESRAEVLHGPALEETDFSEESASEETLAGETEETGSSHEDAPEGEQAEGEEGGEGRSRQNWGRNNNGRGRFRGRGRGGRRGGKFNQPSDREGEREVETLGGDSPDGDRPFRFNLRRHYKIQEVIKRGQIMLIQVSKEERGNKGAAVTTYLSLPGRYCVLMPNSPRGGGVSRKIASFKDRKRMKEMLDELSVPEGMSVILRTAGVARTKVEIKRDLDYLTRLWNTIREHTLKSTAPALIYEEGNLIKRAIRDLYTREIGDVHVSGEEGYKAAKEFMRMLMPSHVKKVQEYKDARAPMYHRFGVESQISEIGEPVVQLRSGGYLVINPTEALVSIDVNSGRATKERHIEETALKTNLEAADEVARQLRLRDLGGLVVIDFIDMEDRRNNRKVEQRLRDALSSDRARIQVGRISSFGLLELSRQRMNPSLAEAQQEICPHCAGIGRIKTLDFSAISIMRALEVEGVKGRGNQDIVLTAPSSVALYILNNKRGLLTDIERRYGFAVRFVTDETLSTSQYRLETEPRSSSRVTEGIAVLPQMDEITESEDVSEEETSGENEGGEERENGFEAREGGRRRRGRRGGRGRRDREDRGNGPEQRQASENEENDNSGNRIEDEQPLQDDLGNRAEGEAPRDQNGRRRRDRYGRGRRDRQDRQSQDRKSQDRPQEGFSENRPATNNNAAPAYEPAPVRQAQPEQAFKAPAAPSVVFEARPIEPPAPREYEKVNQAPESKKKGWWNKLIE
jgi:ribonuclease E